MEKIYTLVYASSARWHLPEIELQNILEKARRHNQQAGVSGLLLYADGNFLQILEGNKSEVEQLYDRIKSDNRHRGVIRLMAFYSDTRHFPDWSMGYHLLAGQELEDQAPGFNDMLRSKTMADEVKSRVNNAIWTLLMSFRQIVNV